MIIFNPLIRDGEILNSNIEILNKFKFSKLSKIKVFSRICFEFGTFGF